MRQIFFALFLAGCLCVDCGVKPCLSFSGGVCQVCDLASETMAALPYTCRPYQGSNRVCSRLRNEGVCYAFAAPRFSDSCQVCEWSSPDGCVTRDVAGVCTACEPGKYLAVGVCTQGTSIPNCAVYSDASTCTACGKGFFLFENACLPNPEKCIAPIGPQCAECAPGLSKTDTTVTQLSSGNFIFGADFWEGWLRLQRFGTYSVNTFTCTGTEITNCEVFSGSCTKCKQGFYLDGSSACVVNPVIADCVSFLTNGKCSACSVGKHPAANGLSCVADPAPVSFRSNCKAYSAIDTCMTCNPGFLLTGGNCVDAAANAIAKCRAQTGVNLCAACESNFYSNSNVTPNVCKPRLGKIDGCLSYSDIGCTLCNSSTYWHDNSGTCRRVTTIIANCKFYSDATTCGSCNPGFVIDGNACVPLQPTRVISGCAIMGSTNTCLACTNLAPSDDRSRCLPLISPITGCVEYRSQTECFRASSDIIKSTALGTPNTVVSLTFISDCLEQNLLGICVQCNDNFKPSSDGLTCESVTPIADCSAYNSQGLCIKCFNGWYSTGSADCTSRPAIAEVYTVGVSYTCSEIDVLSNHCRVCQTPNMYYPANTNHDCAFIPLANLIYMCARYDSNKKCVGCGPGYFLASFSDSINICTTLAYCNVAKPNGECLQCKVNYKWNPTTRVCQMGNTDILISSSDPTKSIGCASGKYLYNNNCVSFEIKIYPNCAYQSYRGGCLLCNFPFQPSPYATGPCLPQNTVVTNCMFYDENGACIHCVRGYFLQAAQCKPIPVNPRCITYSSFTQCSQCEPGYIVDGSTGLCVTSSNTDKNCLTLTDNTTCLICLPSYYPDGGVCKLRSLAVQNCRTYDSTPTCIECAPHFYINAGACTPVAARIPNCVIYLNSSTCKTCKDRFALATDSKSCIPNCVKASSATECQTCGERFYLSAGVCLPVRKSVINCTTYSDAVTCSRCKPGFMLNNNNTCTTNRAFSSTKCRALSASTCALCESGYFLNSSGKCQPVKWIIKGCLFYNKDGVKCDVCQIGWTHVEASKTCLKNTDPTVSSCYVGASMKWALSS